MWANKLKITAAVLAISIVGTGAAVLTLCALTEGPKGAEKTFASKPQAKEPGADKTKRPRAAEAPLQPETVLAVALQSAQAVEGDGLRAILLAQIAAAQAKAGNRVAASNSRWQLLVTI